MGAGAAGTTGARVDDPSLGLPRPFVAALLAAGLGALDAALAASDAELLALHGAGPKGVRLLRAAGPPTPAGTPSRDPAPGGP